MTSVKVVDSDKNKSKVIVTKSFKEDVNLTLTYTFLSDGTVGVKMDMDAKESLPSLVRFGMEMGVSKDYTQTSFYGKGPWENYIDRKRGAVVDTYYFKTKDLFTNYVFPQENGNRSDVRSLELSTAKKSSLRLSGASTFNFSIWPYSAENIKKAKHPFDLKDQGFYTLNIDSKHGSLGGTLSETLPKYVIPSGKYSLEFVIK